MELSPRFVYAEAKKIDGVPGLEGTTAACGYDDEKELVKFKNSWSEKWGDKGFGYLPYTYTERYMMDAWSSVDIEDPNPLTLASILNYRERARG